MARQAARTKLRLFLWRGKSRADGNVYECASPPLLLSRMCHNPQRAPSSAGTQDNVSCLPPVPPHPHPALLHCLPPPFLFCTHIWTRSHLTAHTRAYACTPQPGSFNRLGGNGFSFILMWFGVQLRQSPRVSEGGLAHTRAYTHSRALTFNCQSPAAALVAAH